MVIGKRGSISKLIEEFVNKEMTNYLGKTVETKLEVLHGININNLETQISSKEQVLESERKQIEILKDKGKIDRKTFH
jgi:hypothetical protein